MQAIPQVFMFPILVLAVLCGASPAQVDQNSKTKSERIGQDALLTLKVKDRLLRDVVATIRKKVGVKIIMEDGIDETVSIDLVDVHWRTALILVVEKADCVMIEQRPDVIRIEQPPRVYYAGGTGRPIQQVIEEIAKLADRKIVVSPEVQGVISLRLRNIPWRDALDAACKTLGYAVVEEDGGILSVVPRSNLREYLVTRSFQLRFVRPGSTDQPANSAYVEDTAPIRKFDLSALRRVLTPDLGTLEYFGGSNLLVVKDIKPVIDEIQSIINQIDVKPQQIFLDVRGVRIHKPLVESHEEETNVGWGTVLTGGTIPLRLPFHLGNGLDARILRKIYRETDGSILEILRAPKCVTLDHQKASLRFGIAWAEAEASQGGNLGILVDEKAPDTKPVQFGVDVTPHILPGTDKIVLDVKPHPDSLAPEVFYVCIVGGGAGDGQVHQSRVSSREVTTQVLIRFGETTTVKGLIADDIVLFITAQLIPSEEEQDERIRRIVREREEMVEAELRAIFGSSTTSPSRR